MAWARAQGTVGTTGATFPTSLTTTAFAGSVVVGNLIKVGLMLDGQATAQTTTCTDSKGNTYTRQSTAFQTGIGQVDIWATVVTTGGAAMTITCGGLGNTTAAIIAEEWSGNAVSPTLDQQTSAIGSSTTANPGTTAATTVAVDLVWMAVGVAATGAATVGAGYSNLTGETSSPSKLWVQSKTVAATGTQTGTMTIPSAGWEACITADKGLTAAATTSGSTNLMMGV